MTCRTDSSPAPDAWGASEVVSCHAPTCTVPAGSKNVTQRSVTGSETFMTIQLASVISSSGSIQHMGGGRPGTTTATVSSGPRHRTCVVAGCAPGSSGANSHISGNVLPGDASANSSSSWARQTLKMWTYHHCVSPPGRQQNRPGARATRPAAAPTSPGAWG